VCPPSAVENNRFFPAAARASDRGQHDGIDRVGTAERGNVLAGELLRAPSRGRATIDPRPIAGDRAGISVMSTGRFSSIDCDCYPVSLPLRRYARNRNYCENCT
jgi:hypothetical protein